MPSSIFLRWYDHYLEEPWGYEWEVYRHAEICSYLVNGLYHPKEPVKMSDFYPNREQEPEKEQSWQDMKSVVKGLVSG